jgi:hypothetical protein
MHEIGEFLLGFGFFLSAVVQLLNWNTQRANAKNISVLERNTNSIKDALVRVTGESEHAKGVLAGRQEAGLSSSTWSSGASK